LCALLRKVAEERATQVLLTTHSRHVVDALSGSAKLMWVRKGAVTVTQQDDEIGILLDIGALDVKEKAGVPNTKAVVLTEDEITGPLENVLQASGFSLASTAVLSYYGVTNLSQLRALVKMIRSTNPKAKIVVHRDRDFLTDEEVEAWSVSVRKMTVDPFVTPARDIESFYLNAKFLHQLNPSVSVAAFEKMINETIEKKKTDLLSQYVNGRLDITRKAGDQANAGAISAQGTQAIATAPRMFCGKSILRALREQFQSTNSHNLVTNRPSPLLADETLKPIAQKIFGA